jgi:preprotein translocase subunit YajC
MQPQNLLLLVLFGGLLLLMFSRQRRQQRETRAMQSTLRPGVSVMTTAGLFATVVSIEDQVVILETAPGQQSRWDRRAVARIMPEEEPAAVEGEHDEDAAADEDAGERPSYGTPQDDDAPPTTRASQDTAPPDRA